MPNDVEEARRKLNLHDYLVAFPYKHCIRFIKTSIKMTLTRKNRTMKETLEALNKFDSRDDVRWLKFKFCP